jgi:hypothetical protein
MHGSYATVHKETEADGTLIAVKVYLKSQGRHALLHAHRELRALEQLKLNYESACQKYVKFKSDHHEIYFQREG